MNLLTERRRVEEVLEVCPEARGDDDRLLLEYCLRTYGTICDLKRFGIRFATIPTIRRMRNWVQRERPELRAGPRQGAFREAAREDARQNFGGLK